MRVRGVSAQALAAEMIRQKVWVSAGYTGKPIYLCSESLTAKKTYGTSEWPFHVNAGASYDYREGLCPVAEEALEHLVCIPLDESRGEEYVTRVAAAASAAVGSLLRRTVVPATAAAAGPAASKGSSRRDSSAARRRRRIAIIGCGQMGRWHLDGYRANPDVELVAFVDPVFERAERFAHEAGARAYRYYGDLLENEALDAVSLCTTPSTHRDIAVDCLKAGINVLCEKPLAISVAQAEEMASNAKRANRLLFTAFKFRFHDEVRRAKQMIDAGSLGRILSFRLMFGGYIDMAGQWYADKALSGGGIIMDNGPHAADLIRFLFGNITSISAQVASVQHLPVEDTAKLDVSVANGTVGTGDLSWSVRVPARSYLEIYGEDGAASLDPEGISYRFKTWSEWRRDRNERDVKGAFARQLDYFVGAIGGNNPLALGNGEGVASQRVVAAAYESVSEERRIAIAAVEG
jgi:predicted dehydrogenase